MRSITAPNRRTLIAYILSVIFAGANAVGVRFTVAELAPFWGAAIRFAIAAFIFWILAIIRKAAMPRGRGFVGVVLYGFFAFGGSYAFLYWAIQYIPAGLTQVMLSVVPLMTFFFAFFHRLEKFQLRGLIGALFAVAGIAYAFFEHPGSSLPVGALIAVLAGAACIAESTVVAKMYPQNDLFMTNALAMTVGTVTLLVLSFVGGEERNIPTQSATWIAISYLVLFGSVVVFYLFLYVINNWTASASSYQFVLFPFVTVLVAGWLANETINPAFVIGGILVLVGVWIGALSGLPDGIKK